MKTKLGLFVVISFAAFAWFIIKIIVWCFFTLFKIETKATGSLRLNLEGALTFFLLFILLFVMQIFVDKLKKK